VVICHSICDWSLSTQSHLHINHGNQSMINQLTVLTPWLSHQCTLSSSCCSSSCSSSAAVCLGGEFGIVDGRYQFIPRRRIISPPTPASSSSNTQHNRLLPVIPIIIFLHAPTTWWHLTDSSIAVLLLTCSSSSWFRRFVSVGIFGVVGGDNHG
jgi:hypothetical protein